MAKGDTEAKLNDLIATGAAYTHRRDSRDVMVQIFSAGMIFGALAVCVFATVADRWTTATLLLVVGAFASMVFALEMPWRRVAREWQLSLYWLAIIAITASVYILDVPMLSLLLVLPMMALTYFFGRDRWIVINHILLAIAAFTLPVVTGESSDSASALIITLPAVVAVAALSGVLADRFHTMRARERGRYKATIEALSTALTARDGYTGTHSQETLWFVRAICDELGLNSTETDYVSDVALLHDIGKIGIPNEVLHEPGRLSEEQWETMKQHPVIGERIVVTVPGLEEVARAIRHEHEHWDGGGYPDGLRRGEIPLASRIVLVCDAFHAMTSDRPYRAAMNVPEARLELSQNAGTQFDPIAVGAMLHVLDRREPAVHVPARDGHQGRIRTMAQEA